MMIPSPEASMYVALLTGCFFTFVHVLSEFLCFIVLYSITFLNPFFTYLRYEVVDSSGEAGSR